MSCRSEPVPHRQHVVGEARRLAPRRRERHVQPTLLSSLSDLDPGEAVRVRPDRVVDAGEVHVEPAAPSAGSAAAGNDISLCASGYSSGQVSSFHVCRVRRHVDRPGDELVPRVRERAALGGDRAEQRVEQEQARATPASRPGSRPPPSARCACEAGSRRPATTSATSASTAAATRTRPPRTRTCNPAYSPARASSKYSKVCGRPGGSRRGTPPSSTTGGRTRGRTGRVWIR